MGIFIQSSQLSPRRETSTAVSLVVVNHNAGSLLIDCVESALPQVGEIIIVDNASTDDSVTNLTEKFAGEPGLQIISNTRNLGFAAACNTGAAVADRPYLLFLNPDCRLEPNAVSAMLDVIQDSPETGMVGGLLVNADGSEQGGGRRAVPTPWRSFVRAFGLHRFANRWPKLFDDYHLHAQPLPELPIEIEAISGACMLISRSAMHEVGPWDEGYFLHCEDLDWCMRFRQKGWKIMFVPSARVSHLLGACSNSRPLFVEWHKHKGMVRFYRKFFRHQYPGLLMGFVALGVWLRFGLVSVYHLSRRAGRALGIKGG